jgi:hypothetical protein
MTSQDFNVSQQSCTYKKWIFYQKIVVLDTHKAAFSSCSFNVNECRAEEENNALHKLHMLSNQFKS